MTNHNPHDDFCSVDWDDISEKRDWPNLAWTAAAFMIILIGFFGGMVFRTTLSSDPNQTEDLPVVQEGQESVEVKTADQYSGS